MKTRKVTGIKHRAAAYTIEVGDLDRRVVVVDRIVDVAGAPVGAEMELAHLARFIVAAIARIVGGFDPVTLLQTQDAHPCLGKAPGHSRARRTRADDQYIDRCIHRDCRTWGIPASATGELRFALLDEVGHALLEVSGGEAAGHVAVGLVDRLGKRLELRMPDFALHLAH